MSSESQLHTVSGQPSWRLAIPGVEAYVTQRGAMLAPVTFDIGGKKVQPYEIAPWAEEAVDPATPSILKTLRGDFFCFPFGGNDEPYGTERYLTHGETANEAWTLDELAQSADGALLRLSLDTKARPARVVREIGLRAGQPVVYSRATISGASGPMDYGHHATLQFPRSPGSGAISTSRFVYGQVNPTEFEEPDHGGFSSLKPGAKFDNLSRVAVADGGIADLSVYPARQGFEDLVMLVTDTELPFAWTAVTFGGDGYVWFALKNPRVLRNTIFWISNGGRKYAPWNGRHLGVMGLEETTSYFAYGLKESAEPNPVSEQGYPTSVLLSPNEPLVVSYIMAAAAIPAGFDRVARIEADGDGVMLIAESGDRVDVPVDLSFLD